VEMSIGAIASSTAVTQSWGPPARVPTPDPSCSHHTIDRDIAVGILHHTVVHPPSLELASLSRSLLAAGIKATATGKARAERSWHGSLDA